MYRAQQKMCFIQSDLVLCACHLPFSLAIFNIHSKDYLDFLFEVTKPRRRKCRRKCRRVLQNPLLFKTKVKLLKP